MKRVATITAFVIYLLFTTAFVFAGEYDHHYIQRQTYGHSATKPKKSHAEILLNWHVKNYAWVQVGTSVSPRPEPKGLGPGRWVSYGVWEQRVTKHEWRKECRGGVCRMYRVPVVSRIKHRIDLRKQKSVIRKAERKTRPAIAPARRNWVYYGGNSGESLRRHIAKEHGIDPAKMAGLTDTELRRLHSHAHEGTIDRYWHR